MMRVTLLLFVFGAFAIAMLFLALALHGGQGLRGEAKEIVARVEAQVLGYEPLP